jgi:hypothetical protein
MESQTVHIVSAVLFAAALLHTFATKLFEMLAHRHPRHAGLFHLLGEVEVVFGFWALVLVIAMAVMIDGRTAVEYAESRQYTEPLFVFVIMVVAASRPVLDLVQRGIVSLADALPGNAAVTRVWLGLALVPIFGSFITEPAAMTLAALLLAPQIFRQGIPEWLKYAALGVLFVNVSIGGTLTSYAAPPVLMVASVWNWDTAFMAGNFGLNAGIAVFINATAVTFLLRNHVADAEPEAIPSLRAPIPFLVSAIHLAFLAAVVVFAHHPVIFMGLFLFFLGFTQAYERYQDPLVLKEGLLVGFFLAGLVVLGGMQQWWVQPIISGLQPLQLFFGALGLTAITDNAALTYLGSLIPDMADDAKIMLVAGAVAGGGLTVIANAPNPAGVTLLRRGFNDESIGAGQLFLGALPPTLVAAAAFLIF